MMRQPGSRKNLTLDCDHEQICRCDSLLRDAYGHLVHYCYGRCNKVHSVVTWALIVERGPTD